MTKSEKLLQKALLTPHKISFRELETLLGRYGFVRTRIIQHHFNL